MLSLLLILVIVLALIIFTLISAHRADRVELLRQLAEERAFSAGLLEESLRLDDLQDSLADVPAPVTAWAEFTPRLATATAPANEDESIDLSDEALERLFLGAADERL